MIQVKLAGKVALVAGGASGLGEACVRRLVAQKTKVMILDMDEAKGTKLADELGTSDALFVKTDITNPEQVAGALELSKSKLGSFHIAINCAGIAVGAKVVGKDGPMALNLFNKVIQVNLIGTFNMTRLAAQGMMVNEPEENGGRGVFVDVDQNSLVCMGAQLAVLSNAGKHARNGYWGVSKCR